MTSSTTRSEDTVRGLRLNRSETDEDEMENGTPESGSFLASQGDDPSYLDEGSRPSTALGDALETTGKQQAGQKTLSPEETIELARHAVESGIQDTKRSLAGSEAVTDVVKPKLTIDLGHSRIARIPEPVVDLIKDEVERANNFREFPKGVYKLPLLEILDLSRNKIKELPNEISKLKSLRVLSMMQNRLTDLPAGLSEMHKLQIFKCVGNPLRKPLRDILEETENETTPSVMTDNEKEVAATTKLKRFLMKTRQQTSTPEPEIIADASDGTFEAKPVPTPIPSKRNLSGRFPVIPSTGDGSASSSRSPSISRAPPIPLKSHYRMASGQQGATYHMPGLQRPGVAPHSVNERNRSNSEGIIQGSSVARSKRMGLITRKNTDLGTLDETRPYRNSHLRGLSHGSVLRPRQPAVPIATNDSTSPSPTSPRERRRPRDGWVNRMSSLPEHKGERGCDQPVIRSAKGILFALAQVHSHIDTLINVIKHDDTRRHSLELVFYNASSHVDQLNDALEKASNTLLNDPESIASVTETVRRECETCIAAYIHVGTQLRNNVAKIVSNGDPRYVRSLMLTMFGSLVELRNACIILKAPLRTIHRRGSAGKRLVGPSNPLPLGPRPISTLTGHSNERSHPAHTTIAK
ncbi:RAM signaling pathway SOG2 [Penicillium cf. griseofulvum]|nr:RAM signaling pathway SOG2 [Penicillium cf. griseofulvum]